MSASDYIAELYVHAMAIESEAAARYGQLARTMAAQGDLTAAAVFSLLAAAENRHLEVLRERARGLALPLLDADHSWPEGSAAATVALDAERRAQAFFEQAARVCGDRQTRALALEMAAEEAEHAALIERMLRGARFSSRIAEQ